MSENQVWGDLLDKPRFHLSLHEVGRYERLRSSAVYAAQLAGKSVHMRSFTVTFERIVSFDPAPKKRKWPLVLLAGGDALFELHAALAAAIRKYGRRAADGFIPHMTLLYGLRKIPPQPIEPIRAVFDELVLIHSERGLTRYNVLGRWPLQR